MIDAFPGCSLCRSIPVHHASESPAGAASAQAAASGTATSTVSGPAPGVTTPDALSAAVAAALDPAQPAAQRLMAIKAMRSAATDQVLAPVAWYRAGLVRLAQGYLTEVADAKTAAAHQRHRHETVWMLLELTASDVEGTVDLAMELAKEVGPLLIAFVEGSDTVMVQLCAHALANMLACSPSIPPVLGTMGAAAALGKQLQRMPASVASAAMWAMRQFLALPSISHSTILEDVLPAIQFWLSKTLKTIACSAPDSASAAPSAAPMAEPGSAIGSATQSAIVEACVLLSVVGSSCHEAWLQLADPSHPVVPTACALLANASLSTSLRAPLLEAIAVLSAHVDIGPQVLEQPGMLAALVAMASANAPELDAAGNPTGSGFSLAAASARAGATSGFSSDEIRGVSATSVAYLSLVLAANLVAPGSPEVLDGLEHRRSQLSARRVASALPTAAQLLELTSLPGRPSQAAVAGTLLGAGLARTCCRWLHSTYRMRYQALCTLSALALAGLADGPALPSTPPATAAGISSSGPAAAAAAAAAAGPSLPHLATVMALPGVLSVCIDALRDHRDVSSVGTALGLLGNWLHGVAGAAEAFERAGGRDAIDAMIYSGQCTDTGPASFSPWGGLAAEARRLVDQFLEDEDAEDEDEDERDAPVAAAGGLGSGTTTTGFGAAAPAVAGVGRGKPGRPARWGKAPAVAGASAQVAANNPFAGLG